MHQFPTKVVIFFVNANNPRRYAYRKANGWKHCLQPLSYRQVFYYLST